jgi:putative hemolysin
LLFELTIVVVLTIINGVLAMSELAVVSSRPARLRSMAEAGSRGARAALTLADDPGRFLSTVQIGITLVGVLSGAFSGATLGARMATWLTSLGLRPELAETLGVGSVVVLITYLSLIIGELVPKQIALRDPERVAAKMAPTMMLISRIAAPLVWLLDRSGKAVLALLGQRGQGQEIVTEEEVHSLLSEAETAGVIEAEEKVMMAGVMRLGDKSARALMTPRRDVDMINLSDNPETIHSFVRATRQTRLPVQDGRDDMLIGIVFARDVIQAFADTAEPDLRALVHVAPVVNDLSPALEVLSALRRSKVHMALVFDEYAHFEGVITTGDLLEAITGDFLDETNDEPAYVRREDGSLLVSGWMPADTLLTLIGVPATSGHSFETVGGFVLHTLRRLPMVSEAFHYQGWRFEVVDLDGRRIDKILVTRLDAR